MLFITTTISSKIPASVLGFFDGFCDGDDLIIVPVVGTAVTCLE